MSKLNSARLSFKQKLCTKFRAKIFDPKISTNFVYSTEE